MEESDNFFGHDGTSNANDLASEDDSDT